MSAMRVDFLRMWHGVCAEAVALADAVERLPDQCECGDADAHLGGRCRCCDGHSQAEGGRGGENCTAILERLRADLTLLASDFELTAGPLEAAALASQNVELRHGVVLAAGDLRRVSEAFSRVSEAVAGFRRDCTVAGMRRVKRHCAELRKHCERVNAELFGGGEDDGRGGDGPGLPDAA
jgi:hypothetical protein